MVCEFSKNHSDNKTPEKPKLIIIPRSQPELIRRRSARREQPRDPKKKTNKS